MADTKQVWQAALGELQLQMTRGNFDTWIRDTRLVELGEDVCVVATPNPFAVEWIEGRFAPLIRKTLSHILGRPVEVRFTVEGAASPEPVDFAWPAGNGSSRAARPAATAPAPPSIGLPLNPRYTFAAFVVGSSNRLAHAAAQAVAEAPAQAYNPLFLYGDVGLGKTHLLHAIGHVVRAKGLRVVYVSSEIFTNDLIDAIREGRTDEFRDKYRRADLLLIDDIQFIGGKDRTQEEFFHTFNALHASGGQICLTSDRPPRAIKTLEDRLRSRFEGGLIADIQPPDLETRIAILRAKVESQRLTVPAATLEYVAQKVQSNIRELEGALNRIVAYAALNKQAITPEVAATALRGALEAPATRSLRPEGILRAVCDQYDVTLDELRAKSRERRVVEPRQVAMYLLREETGLSLLEVGALLGGRDHTTVMHGVKEVGARLDKDPVLRGKLRAIRDAAYRSAEC